MVQRAIIHLSVFLAFFFSCVLNAFETLCFTLISNDITRLATIFEKQQQAAKLSTIILIANINGKAHY